MNRPFVKVIGNNQFLDKNLCPSKWFWFYVPCAYAQSAGQMMKCLQTLLL